MQMVKFHKGEFNMGAFLDHMEKHLQNEEVESHKITITIDTGNASFDEDEEGEIKKILDSVLAKGVLSKPAVIDTNGNICGSIKVE